MMYAIFKIVNLYFIRVILRMLIFTQAYKLIDNYCIYWWRRFKNIRFRNLLFM